MKITNIYIEKQIENHPNTLKIIKNIKFNNLIICNNYSEIFNSNNQNFRVQKKYPSMILAKKLNNFVLRSPKNFSIGYENNFYFSHMLNCIYDCKYCYLQGMLNSANYLIFVNYEDFFDSIKREVNRNNENTCFFSGYDCDSLALENITNFLGSFLSEFQHLKKGFLEIRSKSININILKKHKPTKNIIPAFSLNPEFIIKEYEDKTPSLKARLKAMKNLQDLGWSIGIRFDPLIWNNKKDKYKDFFSCVFDFLNIKKIHSVTLGSFRMPSKYLKKIAKIRPNDYFIQKENAKRLLELEDENLNTKARQFCQHQILKFLPRKKLFLN